MTWIDREGLDEDVVVSSRTRIARNIFGHKFPHNMTLGESDALTEAILGTMKDQEDRYSFYRLKDLDMETRLAYVEGHLISPGLIRAKNASFFLREDQEVTIMVNEEDHLRIQVLAPGFSMGETLDRAFELDDFLARKLDYAFDDQLGYLTACPTNTGTGLRASVMVHLPAFESLGQMKNLSETLRNLGLTIRGIYGEGSSGLGGLYQISNQTSLGQAETDLVDKLEKIIGQIIKREREMRKYLLDYKKEDFKDIIYRSLGILKYCRKIDIKEAMTHLSNLKLGVDLDILGDWSGKDIIRLMLAIQPANLKKNLGGGLEEASYDLERASYIRKKLES